MTEEVVAIFTCGKPRDHVCDANGPTLYGGDGIPTIACEGNPGPGYTWGSVSCSKCGRTSMENSMWQDW